MRCQLSVCLLLLGAAAPAAQGEEFLTENEFLGALAEEHPAVAAQMGRVAAAEAARRRAKIFANPTLEFTAEGPQGTLREDSWSLAWAPPLEGRRRLSISAAESGLAAARSALASKQLELRLQMREVFAAWALSQERRDLLAIHTDRLEALARRMEDRAEGGEESGLSARRVRLEATDARASLAVAEADLSRSRFNVLAWSPTMGLNRPARPALPTPPTALDVAGRRDLEAHRFEVEQTRLEEQLSRRFMRFPQLLVGWKTLKQAEVQLDGPVFGFTWSVPLSDRQQAGRLQAAQQHRVAEARLAFATQQAEANVAAAATTYRRLRSAALEMAAGTRNLGRMIEGAVAAYEQGESGITDLLDTVRSVISTELAELDLLAATLRAHRDLEAATGLTLLEGVSP